ncbi:hypothetical protein NSK_004121 [Nannochloropsis salina CCMP1776]|uniref:BZIP domain-containing protein n=1 Tax=Nannochloropsis salina CCMP1776 TaxID=1027361 RepID=A0A4D9D017_9STRA|nr:hypothetical protein NSK_004121 [Nannochloropsis salina CCMP1776]|eukprot:TFJ84656.1 hypothetical protein NSK_004121 [Nannochloropsis salina CCMP1776]
MVSPASNGGSGGGLPPSLPRPTSAGNLRRGDVLPHQQTSQQQQQAQSMTAPHYQVLSPTTDLSQGMEQATICSRGNILQQNSMPPGTLSVPHSKSLRHNDDDDQDSQQVKGNMHQHGQINSLPQAFEKKLRRLEKNRESARECRRRKKEHVVELQKQVAHLEAENLKLKLQLKVGEESQAQERQEKARITKKLDEMVKTGASESDIWQTIDMFKERYSDYGSDRRSAIEFHTNQLEKLLLPTKLTKVCMWMLLNMKGTDIVGGLNVTESKGLVGSLCNVEDAASEPARQLWAVLSEELHVTREQQAALLQRRDNIVAMDADIGVTSAMLRELRALIEDKNSSLDQELLEVQKILSPTQTAKFILWITRNPACMHMLNQLWRAVYERSGGGEGTGDRSGTREGSGEADGHLALGQQAPSANLEEPYQNDRAVST